MMKRERAEIITLLVVALSVASLLYTSRDNLWYPSSPTRSRPLTAALVDEVSAFIPDPGFVNNVTITLTSAGYKVDYYPASSVTIQFLKDLPSKGYGLVILRNHSTGSGQDPISIVTSEPYDSGKYSFEQLTGQVVDANLTSDNGFTYHRFFAVTPIFVREEMHGFFPGSIILLMGCTGLANSEMAQAFVSRGAQVFISWDQVVQAYRSDVATSIFWQQMTDGHSVKESAATATREGPVDRVYQSRLAFYPLNEGALKLVQNS
jgi:hypothetical protein